MVRGKREGLVVTENNHLCKFNSIDKEKLKTACQQFPPSSYLVPGRQQMSVTGPVCLVKFHILIRRELAHRQTITNSSSFQPFYGLIYFHPEKPSWILVFAVDKCLGEKY